MTSTSIRQAGITMVAVTLAARGIGFLREVIIAYSFGASQEVDLFLMSLTIPAILITTVHYSIPNAFVPLWNSSDSHPRKTIRIAIVLLASSVLTALLLWWYADAAIRVLAGGYEANLQARTVELLRIGSAAIVCAVLEAILRSRLLASKQFALSGLSYVWQAVGIATAAIAWRESGATGLMWGFVVGTAASALWNSGVLLASSHPVKRTSESMGNAMSSGRAMLWVSLILLTDSFTQLYSVVDRYFGSYLEPGAIAALNYANLTAGMPNGIVTLALSTAILPFLSDADSANNVERMRSIIDRTVRWALLIAVPISVWILAFRVEITAILFHRGAFNSQALSVTAAALFAAALGIVPVALATVWSRPFYAARNWRPIAITAMSALISKALLSAVFVSSMGSTGLALSTSGAFLVAALLSGFMQRMHIRPYLLEWGVVAAKSLLLVGAPAGTGYFIIQSIGTDSFLLRVGIATAAIVAGCVLLVLGGSRWKIPQMAEVEILLLRRRS